MTAPTHPSTVAGTAKVVRFNWPKYVLAAGLFAAAVHTSTSGSPLVLRAVSAVAGGAGVVWATTSLAATWWVYDHRRVYDHLAIGLGAVGRWASVHAGFDDATAELARVIGHEPSLVVELSMHAGPSLRRARGEASDAVPGAPGALPFGPRSLDVIFLTFAAHEIRDRDDQRALFGELHRSLRPGGRLVLTEHRRDAANLAVYGPGAFHFQRAATWVSRADEAGFDLVEDESITPFVHRTVFRR